MIDHPKLSWCHTRDGDLRNDISATFREANCAIGKLWLMPYLETDALPVNKLQGWVHGL